MSDINKVSFDIIAAHLERVYKYNSAYAATMKIVMDDLDRFRLKNTPLPNYRRLIKGHIERMDETGDRSTQGIINAYSLVESSLKGVEVYDEEGDNK